MVGRFSLEAMAVHNSRLLMRFELGFSEGSSQRVNVDAEINVPAAENPEL